jgi:hypothetical protein
VLYLNCQASIKEVQVKAECKWSVVDTSKNGEHKYWIKTVFDAVSYQDFLKQATSWYKRSLYPDEYILPIYTKIDGNDIDVHWWYDSSEDDYVLAI